MAGTVNDPSDVYLSLDIISGCASQYKVVCFLLKNFKRTVETKPRFLAQGQSL